MVGHWFTRDEWETICRRCGSCCYEKEEWDGFLTFLDISCAHLTGDQQCGCYHERFQREPQCRNLTPAVIAAQNLLPPDCAYVQFYQDLLDQALEAPERGFMAWWRRRGVV